MKDSLTKYILIYQLDAFVLKMSYKNGGDTIILVLHGSQRRKNFGQSLLMLEILGQKVK
jgi:hypothetical protein